MENSNRTNRTDDEFDIEILAEKIYRILKRALRKLWYPFRLFGARPVISLAWIAAALLFAYTLSKTMTKVYETTFLFKPVEKGDLVFVGILHDLKTLLGNGDLEVLAKELSIEEENLGKLQALDYEIIWQSKAKDTANLAYITLRATDPAVFLKVQNGLLGYLENNIHYSQVVNERIRENKYLMEKLGQELGQLDSLKQFLMEQTSPRQGPGFVYGEPPDMVNVFHASIGYYTRQVEYLMEQNKSYSFELLKPVVTPSKPVFPKFVHMLAICLAIAFAGAAFTNYKLINRRLSYFPPTS